MAKLSETESIKEKTYLHNKIQSYAKKKKVELFKDLLGTEDIVYETEHPIIGYNKYHVGTIDGIVSGNGKKILVEVKSYLYDTSGTIAQLKKYKELEKANGLVLLTTLDSNDDEEDLIEMLEDEGIKVIDVTQGLYIQAKDRLVERIKKDLKTEVEIEDIKAMVEIILITGKKRNYLHYGFGEANKHAIKEWLQLISTKYFLENKKVFFSILERNPSFFKKILKNVKIILELLQDIEIDESGLIYLAQTNNFEEIIKELCKMKPKSFIMNEISQRDIISVIEDMKKETE